MTLKNILLPLLILLFTLTCDKAATTLPVDCLGIAGGSATMDECGVCDTNPYNDNLFPPTQEATDTTELIIGCMDCTAEVGGTHWYDDCNICDAYINYGGEKPNYPYSICDCAGVPDGDAMIDYCGDCEGTCESGNSDSCERLDDCNVCDGDNSPNTGICDCTGTPGNLEEDCAGVCGGDAVKDCAQICNGTLVTDSADECCEENFIDQCGICNGYNSSCSDCAGIPNGDAIVDNCGICGGDNSTCTDCTGEFGGGAELDDCGICSGGTTELTPNTCEGQISEDLKCSTEFDGPNFDCSGKCFGTAVIDMCEVCVDDISNGCIQDCQGVWGGSTTCGCFINSANNYYCGDCFGNGENCVYQTTCLSNDFAINPFINPDADFSEGNSPYCNEDQSLTIDKCLCDAGSLISTTNNEFLGNCYNTDNFGLADEICEDCDTGNSWNGGNFYHDSTLCEYYGCTDNLASNYMSEATNCGDGDYSDSCCDYLFLYLDCNGVVNNSINIYITNSIEVAGFQFDIVDQIIGTGSNGLAAENNFAVFSAGATAIAFDLGGAIIPISTNQLLTSLPLADYEDGDVLTLTNLVMSDINGEALQFEVGDCYLNLTP